MIRRLLVCFLLLSASFCPAYAVEPDEMLDNPVLEARAREISSQLRCLVCQNESIDDSNASLAHDLRVLVRERLKAGDTDSQIVDYMVGRYGDFVLLKPRLTTQTYLLWITPFALLLIAFMVIVIRSYTGRKNKIEPLSDEEQKRLNKILGQGSGK